MKTYDTLLEALNDLKNRGYTLDFNLANDYLHCAEHDLRIHPEDFEIIETHRFEGDTNPSEQSVVYAIESVRGEKGVLVNAYGLYADTMSANMVKKLQNHQ